MARLTARRQPSLPAEEGFKKIGVIRTRLALSEREDVNAGKNKGERADPEAERRRMNLLPKEHQGEADAQELPGQDEENIGSLDAPELAVAVVTGMGIDDGPGSSPDWDGRHPARLEERVGDDDSEAKQQAADDRHLAHVGVAASHLPAAMSNDDDRDDVKKLCDDAESLGHGAVE